MLNLMPSSRWTRFAGAAFALALMSLVAAGCDDEASPTTPSTAAVLNKSDLMSAS